MNQAKTLSARLNVFSLIEVLKEAYAYAPHLVWRTWITECVTARIKEAFGDPGTAAAAYRLLVLDDSVSFAKVVMRGLLEAYRERVAALAPSAPSSPSVAAAPSSVTSTPVSTAAPKEESVLEVPFGRQDVENSTPNGCENDDHDHASRSKEKRVSFVQAADDAVTGANHNTVSAPSSTAVAQDRSEAATICSFQNLPPPSKPSSSQKPRPEDRNEEKNKGKKHRNSNNNDNTPPSEDLKQQIVTTTEQHDRLKFELNSELPAPMSPKELEDFFDALKSQSQSQNRAAEVVVSPPSYTDSSSSNNTASSSQGGGERRERRIRRTRETAHRMTTKDEEEDEDDDGKKLDDVTPHAHAHAHAHAPSPEEEEEEDTQSDSSWTFEDGKKRQEDEEEQIAAEKDGNQNQNENERSHETTRRRRPLEHEPTRDLVDEEEQEDGRGGGTPTDDPGSKSARDGSGRHTSDPADLPTTQNAFTFWGVTRRSSSNGKTHRRTL